MPDGRRSGWTDAYSVAGGRDPWPIVGIISIATFMEVLDVSIVNVALNHIAGSLSASYEQATWVLTSYLVSNAVIIPMSGWLSETIGRKRYYMLSVALFTLASLACGMSTSLPMLIAARVAQGIGGGGLAPVEQSMLADTFPPEKRGGAFAAYGVVVIVGPILGPTLGGWITEHLSWHWVFLINAPVGLVSLVLVWMFVDESKAVRRRRRERLSRGLRIDFIGFALIALFLGCLEVTLDQGELKNWFESPMITGFAVISGIAFLALIPWELVHQHPVVNLKLYANRNFAISSLLMLVTGAVVFGSTQFIPQLLQNVMGYTAELAGMALTMGGLVAFVVMPLAGILTNRFDARYLVGAGLLIQAFALWHMTTLNAQISFWDAAWVRLYQAVGLPLLFIPITNSAYVGLRPEDSDQASGLLNVARNLGGTIGISTVQTMLARSEQFHLDRLVEYLNPLDSNYRIMLDRLTQELASRGMSQVEAGRTAVAMLYQQTQTQAQMLSFLDIFNVFTILVLLAFPLVFLMRKPQGGAPAAA